ncbi:Succinate dehydrogenase assembly factor 1, mitochondrial [Linum perenne]
MLMMFSSYGQLPDPTKVLWNDLQVIKPAVSQPYRATLFKLDRRFPLAIPSSEQLQLRWKLLSRLISGYHSSQPLYLIPSSSLCLPKGVAVPSIANPYYHLRQAQVNTYAMGASRLSGMQKQVLSMYRGFLRAARLKSADERRQIQTIVSAEFRRNSEQVDRKNFVYIEYLLNRGKKQLDQLKSPGVVGLSSFNVDHEKVGAVQTQINPNASSYANKEIKNWDNVVLLCGKDRAVGLHVENFQDAAGAMAREEDDTRSNSSFESVSVEGTKAKRSGEGSSNSNKRSKKDQVGDSLMMVANTLQSYYESKKKKEESRHSTKEIYEVLCNISGLSRTEIAKAVIKYNNSDPGQF